MRIIYLNDTDKPQWLFLHTLTTLFKELAPQESVEFTIAVADDQKLFIKTWGQRVLIGSAD